MTEKPTRLFNTKRFGSEPAGRLTTPAPLADDLALEGSVRPKRFEDFVGQRGLLDNLRVFISAAKKRGEALDHVLLYGPPGLGKTTLANIIANELEVSIKSTSGPALERAADLAGLLTNCEERSVLFLDEIHRLNTVVEEYLYPAMEDFTLDIVIDKGPAARAVKLPLKKFTLVGATTRAGLLTSPLRSRFGVVGRLDYYSADDLTHIVKRSAGILSVAIAEDGAHEIARRSRGTPRIANRLLRRVRDFAEVQGAKAIDRRIASESLSALNVDAAGLDEMDLKILETLVHKFRGGPVGLNTLAVAVAEEAETLEELYEPFLIQEGFLDRTPRGRSATPRAFKHLGVTKSRPIQGDCCSIITTRTAGVCRAHTPTFLWWKRKDGRRISLSTVLSHRRVGTRVRCRHRVGSSAIVLSISCRFQKGKTSRYDFHPGGRRVRQPGARHYSMSHESLHLPPPGRVGEP